MSEEKLYPSGQLPHTVMSKLVTLLRPDSTDLTDHPARRVIMKMSNQLFHVALRGLTRNGAPCLYLAGLDAFSWCCVSTTVVPPSVFFYLCQTAAPCDDPYT